MAAETNGSAAAATIRVTYSKSAIGYNKIQKATIRALGFRKLNETRELADTPGVRGMLRKVSHLVTVEAK